MLVLKNNKLVSLTGDTMDQFCSWEPASILKMPYGNIYHAGNRLSALAPQLLTLSHAERRELADIFNVGTGSPVAYVLESTGLAYSLGIYDIGVLVPRVVQMTTESTAVLCSDADIRDMLVAGVSAHDDVEEIIDTISKVKRFCKNLVRYDTFSEVIQEMKDEGRTETVLSQLLKRKKNV